MARFIGSAKSDTITPALVSAGVTIIPPFTGTGSPLKGADTILGNAGDDTVEGDSGDDLARLGTGNDLFVWKPGDGDDSVDGGSGRDIVDFAGSDQSETFSIIRDGGVVELFRDVGANLMDLKGIEQIDIHAKGGNDLIDGSAQTSKSISLIVDAGNGNDTVLGGVGNDAVEGGRGNDTALLGKGDDRFAWDPGDGDDTFDGGQGKDTLHFDGSDDAELMKLTVLGEGLRFFRDVGDITVDTVAVERFEVDAKGGDDTIDGSAQQDAAVVLIVDAGDGADTVLGGAGNDIVEGGRGNDTALLGGGNDRFSWDPGDGDDTFDGGNGTDTLHFDGADAGELFSLSAITGGLRFFRDVGDITVDLKDVERVEINALGGDDTIVATGIAVDRLVIRAGDGDDTVSGGTGNDWVALGNGDDRFTWNPGDGSDSVNGNAGTDRLVFNGSNAAEQMSVGSSGSHVTLFRDIGDITMKLASIERIQIAAKGGDDHVDGSLQALAGVHLIMDGGTGNDILTGGHGGDTLKGAQGDDTLEGGDGADRFVFASSSSKDGVLDHDLITDYAKDQGDVLDLKAAGGFIASAVTADGLVLTLAGGDGDTLLLAGVDNLADVHILS